MIHLRNLIESLESRYLLSADLAIAFSGRSPTSIPAAGHNHVTVELSNHGDAAAAGSATVQLYAADTQTVDANSILLGSAKLNLKLAAGKSIKSTISFNSPTTVNTGTHFLLAQVTPSFADSNPANNVVAASGVRFTLPYVDLTDTVAITPASAKYTVGGKGQKPLKIALTIQNAGTVVAKGPVGISLFGSTNTTLDAQDPLLQNFGIKKLNLNAGKSMKLTLSWKPTAAAQSGTFFGIVQINGNSGIKESTASNDTAITSSKFTIVNAAKPIVPKLDSALTDNIIEVVVGTPETPTFSVTVSNADATAAVALDEVDASGNFIAQVADMVDNGSRAAGDAVAGDGIYSAILPISFSAPGTRYFVAKLTDSATLASGQTPALAVNGANPPTDAQLQADTTEGIAIDQVGENVVADGGDAAQIIAAVNMALQTDSNITPGSIVIEPTCISWETADGIIQCIGTDNLLGGRGVSGNPSPTASPALNALNTPAPIAAPSVVFSGQATDSDSPGSVTVLDPKNFQFAPYDESAAIAQACTAAGFDVTLKVDQTPTTQNITLDDFTNLSGDSAVVYVTHGYDYGPNGEGLDSNVLTTVDPASNHLADLENHRLDESLYKGLESYVVTTPYFADHLGSLDGAIIYLGACNSGNNSMLADAFMDAGASGVMGYTDTVNSGFASQRGIAAFNALLGTDNNTLGDVPGINTAEYAGSRFVSFGDLKATIPRGPKLINVNLVVTYSWPQSQKDLDSKTIFAGAAAGFNLAGGTYLNWLGDTQTDGGSETTIVDLYDAWHSGFFSKTTTVGVGADWYTPSGGAGPAVINVALEDINTEKQYQVQSLTIQPGDETDGATSQQGIINVMLSGSTTDPAVVIKLVAAQPG
jgi:hypothetical protein